MKYVQISLLITFNFTFHLFYIANFEHVVAGWVHFLRDCSVVSDLSSEQRFSVRVRKLAVSRGKAPCSNRLASGGEELKR